MIQAEKLFPFDKGIMLNVVYDTLDRLGLCVTSSNSEQGKLCIQIAKDREVLLYITTVYPQETTSLPFAKNQTAWTAP